MTNTAPPRRHSPPLSKVENALGCEMHSLLPEQPVVLGAWIDIAGTRPMQVDVLLERSRVVLEYDGGDWHGNETSRQRDRRKTASLQAQNYKVIRVREGLEALTALDVIVPKGFYAAARGWKTKMVDEVLRRILPFLDRSEQERALAYIGLSDLQNLETAKRRMAEFRLNPNLYRMQDPISRILALPENPGWVWGPRNNHSENKVGAWSHLENQFICPEGHEVWTIPLHVTISITQQRDQRICRKCISLGQVKPRAVPYLVHKQDVDLPGTSPDHKIILMCSGCRVELAPRATAEVKDRPPLCTCCQGKAHLAKAQAIANGEPGPLPKVSLADLARDRDYDLEGRFGITLISATRVGPGSAALLMATCPRCGKQASLKAVTIRQSIVKGYQPKFCPCSKSSLTTDKPEVLPFLINRSDALAPAAAQRTVGYLCSMCGAEGQRSTFKFRNEPPICKHCTLVIRNKR